MEMLKEDPADPDGHHEDMAVHMMENTCWLYFCCFFGGGIGHCCDPMIMGQTKCLCCYGVTHTDDCYTHDEGLIVSFQKMCCLVTHCGCPPGGGDADGIPCCAVCNQECGKDSQIDESPNAVIVQNTFMLAYCLCCGLGCHGPGDPLCKVSSKICCVRQEYGTEDCVNDHGCCYSYHKTCCCVNAGVCPPGGGRHDGLPCCALCGFTCGGEDRQEET